MKGLKKGLAVLALVCLLFSGCGGQEEPGPKEYSQAYTGNGIVYPKSFWTAPEPLSFESVTGRADDLSERNLKAVFFRGADFEGKETRVFAYLGMPEGVSAEKKVPGVVLVHGGGGTAYKEWVRAWTDRGYAALAIDYQGNMPLADCAIDTSKYVEIPGFTAPKNTAFSDAEEAVGDQWMYWATSAVILGNSLLRAQSGVDPDRVGIAGISWGSIVTTISIGYDDRFAFACPIYGGLYNSESDTYFDKMFRDNPKAMIWEDIEPVKACEVPTLFTMWARDPNFSVRSVSRTCAAHGNAQFSVRTNWYHSHGGGMAAAEVYVFANSVCGKGRPLVKLGIKGDSVSARLASGASVVSIELVSTQDTLINEGTDWKIRKLSSLENLKSEAPPGWEYFYVNVTDDRGWTVSTTLFGRE